ncbi:gluconokinase [Adhaeribacter radiodurans]|uniref:Gluconate kinase n=1 Tax=Adhaeribacter radiodurans TaxID=2745197 RepID=A0A7L7LE88_9BACT|nr:FGGY family carbohydrate kinase [Adhaeribacter radiodurans]QMU31166.1 gluconate kinase [Adhaeribacter radiodurans]
MHYMIGVDIGTTSTKAVGFNLQGHVLAEKSVEYPLLNPQPSYSEQDPDEVYQAVLDSISAVTTAARTIGFTVAGLAGISFSSAMHSLIVLDVEGNLLTNSITWADTRSKEYANQIKNSAAGHNIYRRTGTPIHPMSPLCKLVWMQAEQPELIQKAHKFISIKEYVFYRLFGQYVIDYSIASATGLFDIFTLQWHQPALQLAGISNDHLSTPFPCTHIVRGLSTEQASYLGVDTQVAFILGGSDGCLANLGSSAIRPGNAALTIGTSGAIRVISSEPATDSQERIFSYILTPEHYVLGGPVSNGAILLRWFRDQFGMPEKQIADDLATDVYELLLQKAATIPAGSNGLLFLPYLLGERAPIWDANARGVFFGLNLTHTRAHLLRALLEGILFGVYSVANALIQVTGPIDVIYANGGFAKGGIWVQMLADIFNQEIRVTESVESSALGAVILGMQALGIIHDFETIEKLVPVSHTYLPNPENHVVYQQLYAIYEGLYPKLKQDFAAIAALQG